MKKAINNCPTCGAKQISYDGIKKYNCEVCNWEFYQNTAAAVAGILEFEGKYLAVIRNLEPDKGMLDFPGGFVDPQESAEDALRREIKEELNIDVALFKYLCTAPNIYHFKGIEYSTCDIFYTAKLESTSFKIDESEIAGIVWKTVDDLEPKEFAFISMKEGIRALKKKLE